MIIMLSKQCCPFHGMISVCSILILPSMCLSGAVSSKPDIVTVICLRFTVLSLSCHLGFQECGLPKTVTGGSEGQPLCRRLFCSWPSMILVRVHQNCSSCLTFCMSIGAHVPCMQYSAFMCTAIWHNNTRAHNYVYPVWCHNILSQWLFLHLGLHPLVWLT